MDTQKNYIRFAGNILVITFRFDPVVVAKIRSIDGRNWNVQKKQWEVPKENVAETLEALLPLGFIAHADVLRLAEKEKEFTKELDTIKMATDAVYEGNLPLFDFQRKGASFLKAMPSALLADVPGLGKTIQTIAATEDEKQILVFCPSSLKYSWEAEIKKWQPKANIIVVDGNKEIRQTQWFYSKGARWIIANYELLLYDFDFIKDIPWQVIVADEATRISNPDAQTTKNIKQLSARKRIALTGTPIANKPDDIFSIIDWIAPRYLGTYSQFKTKYCSVEEEYNYKANRVYQRITGYKNTDMLRQKVERFMLRRTKEEVFDDFPKKTVEDVTFPLSEGERKMYTSIKEQIIEEIKQMSALDTHTLGIIPVKMLRLKQCVNHLDLVDTHHSAYITSSKMQIMKELLKPIIESGDKAIIFTQFSEMLHIISRELKEYEPMLIYGDVDEKERYIRVQEFNTNPARRVIVMTEAGAYGLNMQSASYVIHYDLPWSVSKLMQREDRAHRIGNEKPVTVYNLLAKDTIDEYVMKILHRKHRISSDILNDADRMEESGLSQEDIDAILRL